MSSRKRLLLEHFSVDVPEERARRQYGDRCRRSRSPSRSDGGDPAAIPNTENAEATSGKSVKNALVKAFFTERESGASKEAAFIAFTSGKYEFMGVSS